MNSVFKADLHCHTSCSDGTLSPIEVIELAASLNIQGLSITDHDTLEAYRSAFAKAKEMNVELIAGVEFSAEFQGVSVHVLGYSFMMNHPKIVELCQFHRRRRALRNLAILEKLNAMKMPLTEEEVIKDHGDLNSIGRPHIAMAMQRKGYVATPQAAFHLYIGEGKPCYVAGNEHSVEETIAVIHAAKGYAVLAHPHLIKYSSILKDLLKLPFDGLEGFYARLSQPRWIKIAQERNWIITGGSDFHGDLRPAIPLGSSWVNEETFRLLQRRFLENNNTI